MQRGGVFQVDVPPDAISNQLMHYYSTELAPVNVWVNSRRNEYTRLVVPLARTQPALRFAILGISAAHQNCQADFQSGFSQSACRKAILLITDRIRTLTNMDLDRSRVFHKNEEMETPEAVLAATLVICNYSLLESNLYFSLFHLRAARALVKSFISEGIPNSELFIFLRNQVASLDVLACTTLFNCDIISGAVLPELNYGPVVFGSYLHVIHDITLRSIMIGDGSAGCQDYIKDLEDRFDLARASTLIAVGRLMDFADNTSQHDIVLLVEAFHHSGLIYACNRLQIVDSQGIEKDHCAKLFKIFEGFENIDSYLANLSWPIFVAGISIHSNGRHGTLRTMCRDLVSSSPFRYYNNILRFLEELWERQDGDWITMAREWENRGEPVLAM